ncbi:MAG TPA: DNA translocase FtsK [Chitinophagaceae bacterium]|nr:DNA translocase FtsK [Chitinophagaceae bacterium]
MANILKKKKTQPITEEALQSDKPVDVSVKEVVKDERTHKMIGISCILMSIFLFVAFTSYLFSWQEDQDKVFKLGTHFLFAENVNVSNLLGRLGAYLSHLFIYKGFGVASYLFCTFFPVIGVNLFVGKKIFSPSKNIKYVLVGLLYFSITLAFIFRGTDFSYGGAVGELISGWISRFIGNVGMLATVLAGGFAYIVWRFNPSFRLLKKDTTTDAPETVEQPIENTDPATEMESSVSTTSSGNVVKGDGTMLIVNNQAEENNNPLHTFTITEKDEEKAIEENIDNHELPINTIQIDKKEFVVTSVNQPITKPLNKIETDIALEVHIPDKEQTLISAIEHTTLYEPTLDLRDYKYPSLDLLETHGSEKIIQDPTELEANKNQIVDTLKNYDIAIQRISATVGPTVTLYEIVPAAGVRISRIKNLEDDIALSLAALGIRIIAPIPGKGTIGIEVPNVKKAIVSMKALLSSEKFQHNHFSLPIAIGKKIDNENFIVDLAAMPHLLMAGATGQGKSVGLNAILVSLLYKKHPSQLKFVLVDPKKVELSIYKTIENHFLAKLPGEEDAIITDTKKVVNTLNALCIEMDNRYDLLKEASTRNIREYNEKFIQRKLNPEKGHQYLPFIVLVVDEFADLIMTAGKEVEMPIARLAQLARAVGIHLIIATQRPSVNIITGTIKANFPARIAFKVSSKIDSRTILDAGGAEQLIGRGDMLVSYNGEITRLQCAFVDTPEVDAIAHFIGEQRGYPQAFLLPEYIDEKDASANKDFGTDEKDPLFEEAARLIVQHQVGSTSLIQRRMKLGYNRAGRLMDQLEAAGIVGVNQGSKAREVLFKTEAELTQFLANMV